VSESAVVDVQTWFSGAEDMRFFHPRAPTYGMVYAQGGDHQCPPGPCPMCRLVGIEPNPGPECPEAPQVWNLPMIVGEPNWVRCTHSREWLLKTLGTLECGVCNVQVVNGAPPQIRRALLNRWLNTVRAPNSMKRKLRAMVDLVGIEPNPGPFDVCKEFGVTFDPIVQGVQIAPPIGMVHGEEVGDLATLMHRYESFGGVSAGNDFYLHGWSNAGAPRAHILLLKMYQFCAGSIRAKVGIISSDTTITTHPASIVKRFDGASNLYLGDGGFQGQMFLTPDTGGASQGEFELPFFHDRIFMPTLAASNADDFGDLDWRPTVRVISGGLGYCWVACGDDFTVGWLRNPCTQTWPKPGEAHSAGKEEATPRVEPPAYTRAKRVEKVIT